MRFLFEILNYKKIEHIKTQFTSGFLYFVSGSNEEGKCLAKGTKVRMYDGTLKCVEDILVGEQLMSVNSKPTTVMNICNGFENMYKVHQNKGIDYTVNESHILSLKTLARTNKKYGDICNISIKDYLLLSKSDKRLLFGSIPEHGRIS